MSTETYFFDTDCLSAFLWVRGESILAKLYAGRIVLPAQVYRELEHVPHLKQRADVMREKGILQVGSMETGSAEYEDYVCMTRHPKTGHRIIGDGEAAGIAMARHRGGTLASNNLRDVSAYVREFQIRHITTGQILEEALKQNLLTEEEGNRLWAEMLRKRRMLPARTFSEYLQQNGSGKAD